MRVYSLTELGKQVAKNKWEDSDEFRVLDYLRRNKSGTETEMDVITERYTLNKLKREGLIRELTT